MPVPVRLPRRGLCRSGCRRGGGAVHGGVPLPDYGKRPGARLGEARSSGEGTRPSVVLRLAAPGEGLWDIAKAYGTTTQQILQANELEEEDLPLGRMLLIPSTR